MINEDVYSEVIIGIFAIIFMYFFAKWVSNKAFTQVEEANKRVTDSHEKFVNFIENAYTKNINVTEELVNTLKDYIDKKDVRHRDHDKKVE